MAKHQELTPVIAGREMTLLEHLDELRSRIIKVLAAFALSALVAWFFYDSILAVLVAPLEQLPEADQLLKRGNLIYTSPAEAFFVRLKVVSFAAFVLALPVILYQLWRFVVPGLYRRERKYGFGFVIAGVVFFVAGAGFALSVLPRALEILTAFGGEELVLLPRAAEYLSFVLLLTGGFAVAFEMPLVLLALTLVGVTTSKTLRRGRRIAIVVILILSAVITPTQDPITMLIMAAPLALLYEATIIVARLMKR